MTNLPLFLYHYTQLFPIKAHKKKKKVELNKKLFAPHLIFIEDCNIYPRLVTDTLEEKIKKTWSCIYTYK